MQVVVLRVQNLRYLYGGRLLSSLCRLARKRYPNDLDIAQDVVRRKAADAQLRRLVGGALGPRYSHSTQVRSCGRRRSLCVHGRSQVRYSPESRDARPGLAENGAIRESGNSSAKAASRER